METESEVSMTGAEEQRQDVKFLRHKQDPSHFPLASVGSVRASLTGKLSPQTLGLDGPNSYYLHKQCRWNCTFSCIFCFKFFLLKNSHKYLEQAWKKSIKVPKFEFVLTKDDCVLDWGWVKGKKKRPKILLLFCWQEQRLLCRPKGQVWCDIGTKIKH